MSETPKDVESSRGGKPGKGKSGGPMKRKASSVPAQASSPRSHIPKQRRSDLGAVRGGKETAADMDEESDEEMMDLDDLQAFSSGGTSGSPVPQALFPDLQPTPLQGSQTISAAAGLEQLGQFVTGGTTPISSLASSHFPQEEPQQRQQHVQQQQP